MWRFHLILVIPSLILGNLFDFHFTSRVHFIENCSILIQRKLISYTSGEETTLELLKQASVELWLLSDLLNRRCSYSLLTSITSRLCIFVVDVYWIYIRVIQSISADFAGTWYFNRSRRRYFSISSTTFPYSRLHPVLSSRDFSNWSVLFMHLRLQRVQQHLARSQQTIKQRLQQRLIEMRHEIFTAVNDGTNAVYSEGLLRDLKQDSAWGKII